MLIEDVREERPGPLVAHAMRRGGDNARRDQLGRAGIRMTGLLAREPPGPVQRPRIDIAGHPADRSWRSLRVIGSRRAPFGQFGAPGGAERAGVEHWHWQSGVARCAYWLQSRPIDLAG